MTDAWRVLPISEEARALAREAGIHPAIASLLTRRGIRGADSLNSFLSSGPDLLEDPLRFPGVAASVSRVREGRARGESVLLFGDYDVDGLTGTAVAWTALRKIGIEPQVFLPSRLTDGYGMTPESVVREVLSRKPVPTLVIAVDNGIAAHAAIRCLAEHGVDTIVIDHHLPKAEGLPEARAIVRAAEGRGDEGLAACGLAFKFAWALCGSWAETAELLDLVALGTVADLAPVTGENRALLKEGLERLRRTRRPGLRALMNLSMPHRMSLETRDIAFLLAPRLNAAGRMGSPDLAFKLLVTENPIEARNLAALLEEGNRERQRTESGVFEEAVERLECDPAMLEDGVLVVDGEGWHEGVLGIVASRLTERYRKPAIVISVRGGLGKGSGRSMPRFSLFDAVARCEDLLETFGGHAQALGLSVRAENVEGLRRRVNGPDANVFRREADLMVDAEIALDELDLRWLEDLEKLAPFGPGNPRPLFLSRQVRLKGPARRRGRDSLEAWVTSESGRVVCGMHGRRRYRRWKDERMDTQGPFDLVYQAVRQEYQGIVTIELEAEDWRPSRAFSTYASEPSERGRS